MNEKLEARVAQLEEEARERAKEAAQREQAERERAAQTPTETGSQGASGGS
jgi:hypothetical protein